MGWRQAADCAERGETGLVVETAVFADTGDFGDLGDAGVLGEAGVRGEADDFGVFGDAGLFGLWAVRGLSGVLGETGDTAVTALCGEAGETAVTDVIADPGSIVVGVALGVAAGFCDAAGATDVPSPETWTGCHSGWASADANGPAPIAAVPPTASTPSEPTTIHTSLLGTFIVLPQFSSIVAGGAVRRVNPERAS